MKECTDKIIENFNYIEEVKNMKSVKTTAAEYLSVVNPNATNMNEEKLDMFHIIIPKSLFIFMKKIPDIQPKVTFLCNRVKGLYKDDLKKLLIMIKYLQEI